uniref:WAP domain-containing protein n=1 Tax=Otus sunia TaxID=257818 RepID=A0A8C8ABF2_9STRI
PPLCHGAALHALLAAPAHDQPKPGECPVAQPGPCRERCRGDSDCPDVQKCCNSSCGRQCLPAARPGRRDGTEVRRQSLAQQCRTPPGTSANLCGAGCGAVLGSGKVGACGVGGVLAPAAPSHPSDKPGECPKVRPWQTLEPCAEDSCAHDRDCPRQQKCCFSGCAMRCSRPARGERGQAGHRHGCPAMGCPPAGCFFHEECPWGHKCCSNGCGHVCTPASLPGQALLRGAGPCTETALEPCGRGPAPSPLQGHDLPPSFLPLLLRFPCK